MKQPAKFTSTVNAPWTEIEKFIAYFWFSNKFCYLCVPKILKEMPKVKTHSRAKKTFSVTGTGKIKRAKAFKSHLLTKKTTKRKRHLRGSALVSPANLNMVKRLLVMR